MNLIRASGDAEPEEAEEMELSSSGTSQVSGAGQESELKSDLR